MSRVGASDPSGTGQALRHCFHFPTFLLSYSSSKGELRHEDAAPGSRSGPHAGGGFRPVCVAGPGRTGTAAAPASQVPLPDANPALWVVRDDDTTIYLFGTFHLLDGRPWFNDEVRTAFDASQRARARSDASRKIRRELQPLIVRYALDPQGRSLVDAG